MHPDLIAFMMVGNSVRSNVLPVIVLGGRAVHVPYEITWEHEHAEGELPERAVTSTRLFWLLGSKTSSEEDDGT